MSTDFYLVCDNCKEISENALTLNLSGGYCLDVVILDFIKKHFFNLCPINGIRIVEEQSNEDHTYTRKYSFEGIDYIDEPDE